MPSTQTIGGILSRYMHLCHLDGDGDGDIFLINSGTGSKVFLNDGAGVFSDSGQSLGAGADGLCLADLNGDLHLDAITKRESTGTNIWLNDGAGLFTAAAQSPIEVGVTCIAAGDLDGDGDSDLVFGKTENTGGNKVYINNASVPTAAISLGSLKAMFG